MTLAEQGIGRPRTRLPPVVLALGGVSLLNDAASEMVYPLLPAFLAGALGAGPLALGVIEGMAEAIAGLLKLGSGWLSDRLGRRKVFLVGGYALAGATRPLIALTTAAPGLLALRLVDRVGKGLRSAPRDALLAEAVEPEGRGRAFGFHRAMDHAGAMVGPLLAAGLLALGADLRTVFAAAVVPGLAAVALAFFAVREGGPPRGGPEARAAAPGPGIAVAPTRAPATGAAFRRYLLALGLFGLGNSADAFLLLRAQQAGVALAAIPLLWSFHHLVKSSLATPLGAMSDRLGRTRSIAAGFVVYAACYAGFATAWTAGQVWVLFVLYGMHFALVEGAERALVAELCPAGRGQGYGLYHLVTAATLLPASLLTGALWQWAGAGVALGFGAACAGLAALVVLTVPDQSATPLP